MTTTEREVEVVTGTVDSILIKGTDKWQAVVKTPESGTYGKKLWTKDADVFAAVNNLLGQVATFECGVSHYEIEGKPTSSLWINSVNPGSPPPQEPPGAVEAVAAVAQESSGPEPGAAPAVQQPQERGSFGDPKQASIERQVALKAAAQVSSLRSGMTLDETLKWAEAFDQFLARVVPF